MFPMKKIFLLWFLAGCCMPQARAQDLIVKRDSSRIEARVTEISPAEVRYKRFSNPDGPTYVLPVEAIHAIRYANGEEDRFAPAESERTPAASENAAPAETGAADVSARPAMPAPADAPVAEAMPWRYRVGDYYERDGIRGIVCYAEADGQHGLAISLDEAMLPWSGFRKPELRTIGADHRSDGEQNMETVARYIEENGLSWDDFPAFKWCRDHGAGWYLPSIDEMLAIGHGYHGGSRTHSDRKAKNKFNEALRLQGGKRMDRMLYYFTSTEKDEKEAFASHMDLEPPYIVEIPKYSKFLVRAVRKF